MVLTASQIFEADDIQRIEVEIPEWGGSVYVRTLTGAERDKFEASMLDAEGRAERVANLRARLAVLVCCDADGKRIFSTDETAVPLGKKSAAALDRIWDAARTLNRMDDASIEEAEKNFETDRSGDSGSG
jgi:hypothetical protein